LQQQMTLLMKRLVYFLVLFLCLSEVGFTQTWMTGYSYRRKIVIDKSKVVAVNVSVGTTLVKQDLSNFPLLIEIQDRGLIHIPGSCANKIQDAEGRDISFASGTGPQTPLSFQLEHYDPQTGKLTCWIKIPALSANGTASPPTSVYLYYGSALLHDPFGLSATNVWSGDFSRIWHFKKDNGSISSADAQSGNRSRSAYGSNSTSESNFVDAKIGPGIELNGNHQSFHSSPDTSTNITLSAWINLSSLGSEQVVLANDSINDAFRNGYVLRINALGNPALDLYRNKTLNTVLSSAVLSPNKWHHLIATIADNQAFIILNGIKTASRNPVKMGTGGQIRIGSGAQGTSPFIGKLDELRVMKMTKPLEFQKTEYINQENTSQFYTVSGEEYNPSEFSAFTGPSNGLWTTSSNWSSGTIPGPGANVIIPPGKSVRVNGTASISVGKLILNTGALLSLERNLEIQCLAQLDANSDLKLGNGIKLKLMGTLINDGRINLNQTSGTLAFTGSGAVQLFSGSGSTVAYGLENDQLYPANELILNSSIEVSGYVAAKKGMINANGNLTLLANDESHTASVLPVDKKQAAITGIVHVQQYIDGSYPSPATARSWRLLSSPVYNDDNPKRYGMSAYQNSMFITGPGGVKNGFDPSPLNGGTIYTHNQSLAGTLSQKYTSISNTNAKIPLGEGVYVFSRGSRTAPAAYQKQIEQPPFSNPAGYYLNHTGNLYTGDLELVLDNKNSGSTGDGYHLLGNPYASDITWGNLSRSNLTPFVWRYDPVNKDYIVTDEPSTAIRSGTGFFVRVKSGFSSGSLKFSETSKTTDTLRAGIQNNNKTLGIRQEKIPSIMLAGSETDYLKDLKFSAILSRGPYQQQYSTTFDPNGNEQIDYNDAPKIGEGLVNLAAVSENTKLSIERKGPLNEKKEILLYASGWETGEYRLTMSLSEALLKTASIKLIDRYLNQEVPLRNLNETYLFNIDVATPVSQGYNRFAVVLTPVKREIPVPEKADEIVAYPNPVSQRLYLKSDKISLNDLVIFLTNLQGDKIAIQAVTSGNGNLYLDCASLQNGLYLLRLSKRNSTKAFKTLKILKI
jgi:hypothetical protein